MPYFSRDINLLFNFMQINEERLKRESPVFESLCMPGLTEEYKLSVFFFYEKESNLRVIYVCEEAKAELKQEFTECAELLCTELQKRKITSTLDVCEKQMFEKQSKDNVLMIAIDLREV